MATEKSEDVEFSEHEIVFWSNPDGGRELVSIPDPNPETVGDQRQVKIHVANEAREQRGSDKPLYFKKTVPLEEVEKIDVSDVDTEELSFSEGDMVVWENSDGYEKDVRVRQLPYDLQDEKVWDWGDIEPGRTYVQITRFPGDHILGAERRCVPVSELRKKEDQEQKTQEWQLQERQVRERQAREQQIQEGAGGGEEVGAEASQDSPQQDSPQKSSQESSQKKDQQLTARATIDEKREIKRRAAAAGLSVSRFLIESALSEGEEMRSEEEREALIEELGDLFEELRAIGGNVNQIACRLNSGKRVPSEAIERAAEAVEQASDAVLEVMEEVSA